MRDVRNIALVGFMAAGKTTVGRRLAERLGWVYLDTDDLIAERAGRPIPRLFAELGEAGFRTLEHEAVVAAAAMPGAVIACGGGVPRRPENVAALRRTSRVVLLRVTPEAAAERILADGAGRPMIDDHIPERSPNHVLARVTELLNEREPFYEAAADVVVDVAGKSVDELVDAVLAACAAAPPREEADGS